LSAVLDYAAASMNQSLDVSVSLFVAGAPNFGLGRYLTVFEVRCCVNKKNDRSKPYLQCGDRERIDVSERKQRLRRRRELAQGGDKILREIGTRLKFMCRFFFF
jgi:hypothetical protein